MKEVFTVLEEYNDESVNLKGFQKIDFHMIFDVNMGKHF